MQTQDDGRALRIALNLNLDAMHIFGYVIDHWPMLERLLSMHFEFIFRGIVFVILQILIKSHRKISDFKNKLVFVITLELKFQVQRHKPI